MPTLLLVRHGENDWLKKGILVGNTPGVPLNEKGIAQAAALGKALQSQPIRVIYSSPLQRAVETAQPLAQALGLEIQVRPALSDTNVGDWAGRSLKELHKLPEWKQLRADPASFRFPGGESFPDLQQRLVNDIHAILRSHRAKDLLAVFFHADPIKLVLSHFLGLSLDHFQQLTVDTGSVSLLALNAREARLEGLNLKPPFEGNFPEPK